jgi:hypothetical protein
MPPSYLQYPPPWAELEVTRWGGWFQCGLIFFTIQHVFVSRSNSAHAYHTRWVSAVNALIWFIYLFTANANLQWIYNRYPLYIQYTMDIQYSIVYTIWIQYIVYTILYIVYTILYIHYYISNGYCIYNIHCIYSIVYTIYNGYDV